MKKSIEISDSTRIFPKEMTRTQQWLLQHIITAFWHGFGIANSLVVPKEFVKIRRYSRGTPREVYEIDSTFMHKKLVEYIKWLEQYEKSWNTLKYEDSEEFSESDPSRLAILKMLNLLQL